MRECISEYILRREWFNHQLWPTSWCNPAGILLKINSRNTKKRCEICSKLTIKTPEWRHLHHYGVFFVNFEQILRLFLLFLLLNLNIITGMVLKTILHIFKNCYQFLNILRLFNVLPRFLSPQVKQCAIITYNHSIYELPYQLPNYLRLRILGK